MIKTLLHRTFSISSNWNCFNEEVQKIKQRLINNNFPLSVVNKEIKSFINLKTNPKNESRACDNMIKLFFCNQMSTNYKQREKNLNHIIKSNINAKNNKRVKLNIYYRNKKLKI